MVPDPLEGKMRITMLQTVDLSPYNPILNKYEKGQTYDISDAAGGIFLDERWAEPAPSTGSEQAKETKVKPAPAENK